MDAFLYVDEEAIQSRDAVRDGTSQHRTITLARLGIKLLDPELLQGDWQWQMSCCARMIRRQRLAVWKPAGRTIFS